MNFLEQLGLRRTAVSIAKRSLMLKIAFLTTSGIILVVGVTYTIAVFYKNTGSFTVNLNRYEMLKNGISLSETKDFDRPLSRLTAPALENVYNISVNDLPSDLDTKDGSYGTNNFIAFTYYVRNTGESTITYKNSLDIESATMGIEAAIRIRVYDNSTPTTYALPKSDGSGAESETTPFASNRVAMESIKSGFAPGDTHKYTVVIWLEGDDPECVDDIIGGVLKMVMNIRVVEGA